MHTISRLLVTGLILVGLVAPLSTLAAIIPIGGRVITTKPCLGGGWYFTVAGFGGIGSGAFVWYPGSITYPYGLPRIGVNILGTADASVVCMFGKVPLPGFRVFMEGTSLSI